MLDRTKADLWELHRACLFLLEQTASKSAHEIQADYALSLVVERLLERIGETMRRIYARDPETALRLHDYRRVIDLRNIIADSYYALDWERIRLVLDEPLPMLLASVDLLISEFSEETE